MSAGASFTDKNRLLLAAGFVFGVMFTLIAIALVTLAVSDGSGDSLWSVLVTIAAGTLFTGVVGVSLYMLAFPENRIEDQIESLLGSDDESEER